MAERSCCSLPTGDRELTVQEHRLGRGFRGDAVCAKCHEQLSRPYQHHAMGRSADMAGTANTPGLSEAKGVAFEARGFEYAVELRNGKVVHSETRKGATGEVVARIEAEIAYVIGSAGAAVRTWSSRRFPFPVAD